MEIKSNYQFNTGKEANLNKFNNLNQNTKVKQLINELNEKTKLIKQGESPLIAKLITNDSGNNRKLGNNILNIDNSRKKSSSSLINNQLNKRSDDNIKTVINNGKNSGTSNIVNGQKNQMDNGINGDGKIENTYSFIKKRSSLVTTSTLTKQQTSSSGEKNLNTVQETSPKTVESKPQLNQQYNSSSIIQLSNSSNQLNYSKVDSKKRSLKKFFGFAFSSLTNKKSNQKLTNLTNNKQTDLNKSDLNNSRSSLTSSANKDRVLDSLIVDTSLIDPTNLPQSVTVISESAKCPKTTTTDSKSRVDETSVVLVKNLSIDNFNNLNKNYKSNNKISTANNSSNHSHHSNLKEEENSSNSSIQPVSQSSKSSFSFSTANNYSLNNNNKIVSTPKLTNNRDLKTSNTKTLSTDNHLQNYQINTTKKSSIDSTTSDQTQHLSDISVGEQLLFTKTASSSITKANQESKINKFPNCLSCGDHLDIINKKINLLDKTKNHKNSMSGSGAAALHHNASDAYLNQLSAQQLNQLIMDQAFIPQNNTSNSTQSNSLSNHGNGTNNTLFDSESSEQFKRLLCRKCRPNRTGIVQHSHNSNSKFARNLHASATHINPRHGWTALKEYSKGSIKRLKKHKKNLSNYARAMKKQHLNNSGSSGGGLTSGDLSDNVHQAALANMVLNAMNPNKLNGLNNSPNFCKECYLERMLTHQNNGLINNDYQQISPANKNPVCLSCYNNLNNAFSMLNINGQSGHNYDLPPVPQPLPQKLSSFKSDADFLDSAYIDKFWDVEQWRNKLKRERLRKKERNVLMVVSSVAIIVFIGISYFGTILFLRLTRLQNEEQ